ncbi:sigma factor-like helix-turn-helix DNA-binding protein [Actinosynnema sp. NPDC020468]|uniref:sigma factor-like helix-turn-helix DNA-binding protein n=1 Tax=Actinosynnema sp. NPDC020468 TaxID=3154488 RepID=UPI00340EE7EB
MNSSGGLRVHGGPRGRDDGRVAEVLAEVIGALAEEHREALCETYLRGRTVREAAQVLGIPESTVKSRVYHAMKIIRRALPESG